MSIDRIGVRSVLRYVIGMSNVQEDLAFAAQLVERLKADLSRTADTLQQVREVNFTFGYNFSDEELDVVELSIDEQNFFETLISEESTTNVTDLFTVNIGIDQVTESKNDNINDKKITQIEKTHISHIPATISRQWNTTMRLISQ